MIKKHWTYFKYVARHKWFVFVYGLKRGVPIWRLIIHDMSKYSKIEWTPYVDWFYGGWRNGRDNYQGEDVPSAPPGLKDAYDYAWNHHQKVNPHHWQHYIMVFDNAGSDDASDAKYKILPMPVTYMKEMLADWDGAGRAITGKADTKGWYLKNKAEILLHPSTREWVEKELGIWQSDQV